MRLSIINEIQHKYSLTNMDRNSVCGAYASNSINDLFHVIYGRPTHLTNHKKRKSKKTADTMSKHPPH